MFEEQKKLDDEFADAMLDEARAYYAEKRTRKPSDFWNILCAIFLLPCIAIANWIRGTAKMTKHRD